MPKKQKTPEQKLNKRIAKNWKKCVKDIIKLNEIKNGNS